MMKRPCDLWTMAFGAAIFTLVACGGSPSTTETGSGGTMAATESGTGTAATETGTGTAATETGTGTTTTTTGTTTTTPTTGGPDGAMFCEERCMIDADCAVGGDNSGVSCKDSRCVYDTADLCVVDQECQLSGPSAPAKCTTQADCGPAACVDIGGGVGYCAVPEALIGDCGLIAGGATTAMYPPIEGGAAVTVCVFPEFVCRAGECFHPCKSDDDCSFRIEPTCDVKTGECVCTSDADCKSDPEFSKSVCIAGQCGCGSDADCVGDNVDRCYEGVCGCSSAAACTEPKYHDGTMLVCE